MHFHPKWDGFLRPDVSDGATLGHRSARGLARSPLGAREARASADASPRPEGPPARERLGAERIALIRQRVREGFYASPQVMSVVAARLLHRGDL